MAIDKIEKIIREQKNKNEYASDNLSEDQLEIILKIIAKKVAKGKKIFSGVETDFFKMTQLIKIEAEIINLITTAIFKCFEAEEPLEKGLLEEAKFAYSDYINTLDFYAKPLYEISFLAKFYMEEIVNGKDYSM